jgi:DNA-binding MarR family transcriptional regulator
MKKNYELNFLRSLEEGKEVTQKSISNHISVSIGFVNTLIKKFLKKGVIKVQQAPYKRFIYYLTPEGFSEKSKLVLEYVTDSLSLFRLLRKELNLIFSKDKFFKYYLYGISEITEIAILSANEVGTKIVGIIEPKSNKKKIFNINILKKLPKNLTNQKILICCTKNAQKIYFSLLKDFPEERIVVVNSLFISKKEPNFKPKPKNKDVKK